VGVCICEFFNVWMCAFVGFLKNGFVHVWVFKVSVCACVCFVTCGYVHVWVL
jgi:hypothetical protein